MKLGSRHIASLLRYLFFGSLGMHTQPLVPARSWADLPLLSGKSMTVAPLAAEAGAAASAFEIFAAFDWPAANDGQRAARTVAATATARIFRGIESSKKICM